MADVLYEVEQIVGKRIINKRRASYLVRWKGFSSEYDSWEPANNLHACHKLIALYDSNDENPVIREDSSQNTVKSKQAASPEKQHAKGENKMSKNVSKEDLPSYKKSQNTDITPEKGMKGHKESLSKSLPAKQAQTDLNTEAKRKLSLTNGRSSQKKPRSSDKLGNNSLLTNSVNQNSLVKSGPSKIKQSLSSPAIESLNSLKKPYGKRKQFEAVGNSIDPTENVSPHQDLSVAKKQKFAKSKAGESCEPLKSAECKVAEGCSQTEDTFFEEDVVDLTKNDGSSSSSNSTGDDTREEIEISDDEDEDDDENVLYSLNSDCDLLSADNAKMGDSVDNSNISVISKSNDNNKAVGGSGIPGPGKKKKMSLIDSKKSAKAWGNKSSDVRSVSPPLYTSVKDMMGNPANPDPSKPSGNSLPDPVSPEASETYLADVPSSFPVPAEEPVTDEPLSPGDLLYKSLLDSLPHQLYPSHKGHSKKRKGDSSRGMLGKSLFGASSGKSVVERRTSVRSTECAFRYKQIVVKKCSRYTQIWLNTTTVMTNALNPMVIQEIISALNSAKYDDSRLVLFSGLGNVFCSGTDLHFLVSGDRAMAARQMAEKIRELTKTFITFPKPVIAAVSGAAVGLGVAILALCDVVYASDKASFHMPYSQLSQTPEACSSFTLPLTLGLPSANELLYGGRKITAMEAYQLGLVSQVFWPTLMMQEIIPRAQNMASCSAKALEATKLLVRSHHRTKMELTNETECNLLLESWFSVECQQAIEAYIGDEKNMSF